jgi:hypothetical protein
LPFRLFHYLSVLLFVLGDLRLGLFHWNVLGFGKGPHRSLACFFLLRSVTGHRRAHS